LRNLITAGHVAPGDVDERSIEDVKPDDLQGYTQCHFFAGIGIWSAALRAEGWPDDKEIWTGSCPCQPLSGAGQRKGHLDERHLWPAFYRLIAECNPATVIGEQVASGDGREWLAAVRTDLETLGYAVGAADLCAAGAGAPHIRQRLYWVANSDFGGCERSRVHLSGRRPQQAVSDAAGSSATSLMAGASGTRLPNAESEDLCGARRGQERRAVVECDLSSAQWIACTDGKWRPTQPGIFPLVNDWPAGNRMAVLRAAGNALHLETARQFIRAILNS
jgi:DNA (cytosine-5)-methyltransferase 1